MEKINLETETIQLSIYSNIIQNLLKDHEELSVLKTVLFSYLLKKNTYLFNNVFDGRVKREHINKAISLIAGNYDDFCTNIPYILKSIHLLKECNYIIILGSKVFFVPRKNITPPFYKKNTFDYNTIELSKYYTDKQILKELISNV